MRVFRPVWLACKIISSMAALPTAATAYAFLARRLPAAADRSIAFYITVRRGRFSVAVPRSLIRSSAAAPAQQLLQARGPILALERSQLWRRGPVSLQRS